MSGIGNREFRPLKDLRRLLESRYPQLRVIECEGFYLDGELTWSTVRFQGTATHLVASGLAEQHQFSEDGTSARVGTELGDWIGIYQAIDDRSRNGCWDLCAHSGIAARDPISRGVSCIETKKIQSEVNRHLRRAFSLPRRPQLRLQS